MPLAPPPPDAPRTSPETATGKQLAQTEGRLAAEVGHLMEHVRSVGDALPMSGDQRLEKVQRLLTAHRKTKEVVENEPVSWELHAGSDIARKWPVITAAYSGLEQTLKYLIAEEKGKGIAELIRRENGKRSLYETHNVAWLFSELENPTQEVVRDFYGRYQSLHSYITVETVDEFLRMVR